MKVTIKQELGGSGSENQTKGYKHIKAELILSSLYLERRDGPQQWNFECFGSIGWFCYPNNTSLGETYYDIQDTASEAKRSLAKPGGWLDGQLLFN